MSRKRSELYSVYKHSEGYAGQVEKLRQLNAAGIECKRAHSPYIGQSGIEVFGNARVQKRAEKILFGWGG
jgi:hypothetical protein